MPLEWTHGTCSKPGCDGTTNCEALPTVQDRINMARAAYAEYGEADETPVTDFALDVLLFAQSEHRSDDTFLEQLAKQARREWKTHERESAAITPQGIMRRYPRITAHVIAESLGYATPTRAAHIVRDAKHRQANWCEWIDACYNRDPLRAVQDAIRNRHHHTGYMAEYKLALALVHRAIQDGNEPTLASWF